MKAAVRRLLPTALLIVMCLSTLEASAHSKGETTVPRDGATLAAAPERVAMTFDMPMRITLIALRDGNGQDYELEREDGMQPVTRFEAVPPAELPPGTYTVEWRGLAADGHPMQGTFSFRIED